MSAKWRALQHRHRYTYSAVHFSHTFVESLNSLLSDESYSRVKFFSELKELISLNSTYAEVNHVKTVASAFGDLLTNGEENLVFVAARFYLEILFLDNSAPLHRTLVSVLSKSQNYRDLICGCLRSLYKEYGGGNSKKKFCVSRVALSMLSTPKLGYLAEVVDDCAATVALDVVFGLRAVVSDAIEQSWPSPIVMEQCQEALSCLYYLVQRFPSKLADPNSDQTDLLAKDSSLLGLILTSILDILKSSSFSRDCFVAAGVSFCATIQLCLNPQQLGVFILEGIFYRKASRATSFDDEFHDVLLKIPCIKDMCNEINKLSALSRLSMIRGIVTAVPRTVLNAHFFISTDVLNGFSGHITSSDLIQTILYDAILPELCNYCENPIDSHLNFHALTVLQICLQQVKTSLLGNPYAVLENYDPISEEMGTRILKIIWNNLEDPLSQTVKQVHLIFDLFLDIQPTLHWAQGSEMIKSFLWKISRDLLCLGPRCKGRYAPLASLTKRLGAKTILDMSPDLLFETVQAYIDDDVCCAATSFLKCFLECLRDESWSSDGVESGYSIFRGHCLPPVLYGLASGVSKLRSNLNTYALSVLLCMDVDCVFLMLASVSVEPHKENTGVNYPEFNNCADLDLRVEQKIAILVSLLKVSRVLALMEGNIEWSENSQKCSNEYALVSIKGIIFQVPIGWLMSALTHEDESLRIDVAESLFLNPKTSNLPSHLELSLMKEAVPLNMRCCSTGFQMKWTSLFRKFFARVRTALDRQLKLGGWRPGEIFHGNRTEDIEVNRAEDLFLFMRWLGCFLFYSCYPSSPYERKIMAMELILIMIDVWPIKLLAECKKDSVSPDSSLALYSKRFTLPDSTLMFVGSIIDSWDRLRENSFHILLHFPTPLPGISSEDMVWKLVLWAKRLLGSPRVRETDAGALTLRLVFKKYVLELGWMVSASLINRDHQLCKSSSPVMTYINSLIDCLLIAVEEGEKDLSKACKNSFVHGILLALRYTFEELDWSSDVILSSVSDMKCALNLLLELVTRIASLALWVVSSDSWYLSGDTDDVLDDDIYQAEVPAEAHEDVESSDLLQNVKPPEQIVMLGCWLAMKEVSLLLGTIIRKIPLPRDVLDLSRSCKPMIDMKQLEMIGSHFLEVLLKMKHNGAIDKTRAGFTALCNRLLCSNDPRLCKLTESWMEQLMARTVAKRQVVDDLLRRSAGIPAAFIALFLSEPEGSPKKLLPRALRWLIDIAKQSLLEPPESDNIEGDPNQPVCVIGESSKIRDEGVIPTVHAFNVLRVAFNDTNLGTDTSGFSAEALIVSIRAFSSPYWEIRNSACLAYTALVRRMVGFLNVQKRESARRALTGLEFFHRHPSLYPFLFNELRAATELLRDGHHDLENVVHPSLCPILILLSRLKPSAITSETGDTLDPFLYMSFIRRCSTQSNLRVRILASRALTGLVSNEKLPSVMLDITSELPSITEVASFNSIHGMLLQLSSLLDTNCRNLADFNKKERILADLIPVLVTRSWIGRPGLCPCPILNASFLALLDYIVSIAGKNFSSIHNLILQLSSECLDMEKALKQPSYYDPTVADLRKQAAMSYFNCVFQASKEYENGFAVVHERLVLCISDASYEVRLATLKWLYLFLNSGQKLNHCWAETNYQATLMKLLTAEKNHKCLRYILRILSTWNIEMDFESVLKFWELLVSFYKLSGHLKTREAVICCMGVCVKRFSGFLKSFVLSGTGSEDERSCSYKCINYFFDLIKQWSGGAELVSMRKASVEAIVACGLLEQAKLIGTHLDNPFSDEYGGVILDLWFTCIGLLEDEDVGTRQKLSVHIQKCLGFGRSGFVQVEKMIERSFEFLSLTFGSWCRYLDQLARLVLGVANCTIHDGDPVRRIFEKEIDNHHEEKLLICQICCFHLERLQPGKEWMFVFSRDWRERFQNQLACFAKDYGEIGVSVDWIGGMGNHKDAFLAVYANLLGFYAFSKRILSSGMENGDPLVCRVAEVGRSLRPFVGNPLIHGLYSLVVKLQGKVTTGGVEIPCDRDEDWEDFDPYFLLR